MQRPQRFGVERRPHMSQAAPPPRYRITPYRPANRSLSTCDIIHRVMNGGEKMFKKAALWRHLLDPPLIRHWQRPPCSCRAERRSRPFPSTRFRWKGKALPSRKSTAISWIALSVRDTPTTNTFIKPCFALSLLAPLLRDVTLVLGNELSA